MANVASIEQLLTALKASSAGDPKFVLFLGAGASVSSGVSTGGQLVRKWRQDFDASATDGNKSADQTWFNKPSEYGALFEHHHKTEALRREFIEECVVDAHPSWGYLYLADLLDRGYFNIVLTTNFDDLINEACHAFTASLRPIIYAHDSSAQHFRLVGKRPKVIKLHGDYLFDNIANSNQETLRLKDNIRAKVEWLAKEFGFVVIGYSGGDESVMSVIVQCLQKTDTFPNGLFWCVSSISSIPARLVPYENDPRLQFVECEDFDGLMERVHEDLVGEAPPIIADFQKEMTNRIAHLVSGLSLPSTATPSVDRPIQRHLKLLADSMSKDDGNATSSLAIRMPLGFAGYCHFVRKEYKSAANLFHKEITTQPQASNSILVLFFECLRHIWDENAFDDVCQKIQLAIQHPSNRFEFLSNAVLSLIHGKQYDAALRVIELAEQAFARDPKLYERMRDYNQLNRAQITLHRGEQLSDTQASQIQSVYDKALDAPTQFGCSILLDKNAEAVQILKENISEFPAVVSDWPIIDLMSTPQRNAVLHIVGTGVSHIHNLKLEFQMVVLDSVAGSQ